MNKQSYLVSEKSKIAIIALHGWTGDALSMKPAKDVVSTIKRLGWMPIHRSKIGSALILGTF